MGCKQSTTREVKQWQYSQPLGATTEPPPIGVGLFGSTSSLKHGKTTLKPQDRGNAEAAARRAAQDFPTSPEMGKKKKSSPKPATDVSTRKEISPQDSSRQPQQQPTYNAGDTNTSVTHTDGSHKAKFKNGTPAVDGEIFPCFANGLLWRILKTDTTWAFYNDTQEYEMYVQFKFGPDSKLKVAGRATTLSEPGSDGWLTAKVIVYPGDTELFVKGSHNGYKSSVAAKPLSQEYRNKLNAAANSKVIRELDCIARMGKTADEVTILELCLAQRVPYVDVVFPPQNESLSRPGIDGRSVAPSAWKRPTDFVPKEHQSEIAVFCGGISPNDIDQGQLGDCWLLCAIAALAEFPDKVRDIFAHPVSDRAMLAEQAIGAYRLTFNKHGWWHVVIVDDYFPTIGSRQCFAHTTETPGELWVSLLEKGYAKLHGSYASITGGDALQALQDLTGYPTHRFDTYWQDAVTDPLGSGLNLFHKLETYDKKGFLINLNTPGHDISTYMSHLEEKGVEKNSKSMEERYTRAGLALGHAYTCIDLVSFPNYGFYLLKIRNPWGNEIEWTGDWSDDDPNWAKYPDVAKACSHCIAADGTFWMSWVDALSFFDGGGVCFMMSGWHDYRAKGTFQDGYPSLTLEVTVSKRVDAFCTFSQQDKRGLPSNDPYSKYTAAMLSVSKSVAGTVPNRQEVDLNSTGFCDAPSKDYTFNYARDLGMSYTFTPEGSPYYIIPRAYDAGTNKRYVLGFIANVQVGDGLEIGFKALDRSCKIFHNYPKFSVDEKVARVAIDTEYQFNPEVGPPVTARGSKVEV